MNVRALIFILLVPLTSCKRISHEIAESRPESWISSVIRSGDQICRSTEWSTENREILSEISRERFTITSMNEKGGVLKTRGYVLNLVDYKKVVYFEVKVKADKCVSYQVSIIAD